MARHMYSEMLVSLSDKLVEDKRRLHAFTDGRCCRILSTESLKTYVDLRLQVLDDEHEIKYLQLCSDIDQLRTEGESPMDKLTPPIFETFMEEVFQNGAKKYEAHGWKYGKGYTDLGNKRSMLRHLMRFIGVPEAEIPLYIDLIMQRAGEAKVLDAESGLHHCQHLATRALMPVYLMRVGSGQEVG